MGKIQIGREGKREYESVKFFTGSVEPEKKETDEVQQPTEPAQVVETPAEQARPQAQEEPAQEKPSAPKKEVPVAKQSRKKGGKR